MVSFKCKMCGGELEIIEGSTVCECEFCGTKQTVPTADNEKKMTLFNRANRLRFNNEFDKAAGVYESIVADFPEEAEAYWGLVLCKYGIEYVDDPATGRKIPTCHRSSFDSVFEDSNFDMVMEYADAISRRVYRDEAKQIEEIRKGIVEVSSREEPYDIFICYKETDPEGNRTLDSVIAQDIYNALTEKGYRVFFSRISLEDKLGVEYEPYIFAALQSAKVMLAVGTDYEYYDAVWVKNEWSRFLKLIAAGEKKTLIPVYKNLDAYDMPKEFARLQAQDMGKVGAMQDLLRGIDKIFGRDGNKPVAQNTNAIDPGISVLNAQTAALLKRGNMALEDGDYTRANDLFEQVLNNDAECGSAYWGKVLCGYQVSTTEILAKKLLNQIISKCNAKTDSIAVDVIKAAREANGADTYLNDFSDADIVRLMTGSIKSVQYQSFASSYKEAEQQYGKTEEIIKLINNRNCERALKYKDPSIATVQNIIVSTLRERIIEENNKSVNAVKTAEYLHKQITESVAIGLTKISEIEQQKKKETEKKQREAEEYAEKAYQNALINYKEQEDKRRKNWEEQKKNYEMYFESSTAKKNEIEKETSALENERRILTSSYFESQRKYETEIDTLEKEKNALTGFFTGKKRRELEEKIVACKIEKDSRAKEYQDKISSLLKQFEQLHIMKSRISIPKDPGDWKETIGNPPNRDNFIPRYPAMEINKKRTAIEALESSGAMIIRLGIYPGKNVISEPITWRAVDFSDGKTLLVADKAILQKEYNEKAVETTWEKCTLRNWLNSDFYTEAFNDNERSAISRVSVKPDCNPQFKSDPGKETLDYIFLLSIQETQRYFSTLPSRTARYEGESIYWWLRTPGRNNTDAVYVEPLGTIVNKGYNVMTQIFVRPAMWIDLSKL